RTALKATAALSDGTNQDVTAQASWQSSNSVVAQVSAGQLLALAAGEVDVTVTYLDVTASIHVAVTPPTVKGVVIGSAPVGMLVGDRALLKVGATFSDDSKQDVTGLATWDVSNRVVAQISAAGEVNALSLGEVDVRASFRGMTASVHIVVAVRPPATVKSVAINGIPSSVAAGDRATLIAIATFSDGTTQNVTT